MSEIYISDAFHDWYQRLRVRKYNVDIPQMLLDGYDASEQLSNPDPTFWYPPDDSMSCTLSAFGLLPDGQSVIISCPETNQIYRHSVEENQGAYDPWGYGHGWIKISENITGSEVPPEVGYTEGIGTAATFRYPGSISVSPDGTWAVIAE